MANYPQTTIEEINGKWFVCTDSTDIDPQSLRWQDRGNGPELVEPSSVYGPFRTERAAQHWLDDYMIRHDERS